ncbi:protein of unknown function (plasmid) [Cupriavidus taiwanensis]|nr:protein of unknown function [Cupriavidus taiwanensis]
MGNPLPHREQVPGGMERWAGPAKREATKLQKLAPKGAKVDASWTRKALKG